MKRYLPTEGEERLAIWALTPNGAKLACRIRERGLGADLFVAENLSEDLLMARRFGRLKEKVSALFGEYDGHLFIMSAGIVVRTIAPLIRHKLQDPAVVVLDELGHYAISLLSGHVGGANRLASRVAKEIGAIPVITTATDLNQLPSIDTIAREKGLYIENPEAIRHVSMALLNGGEVGIHDPFGTLSDALPDNPGRLLRVESFRPVPEVREGEASPPDGSPLGVWIDDREVNLPERWLRLRPPSLVVGMGCNRGTETAEMLDLLNATLAAFRLSSASLTAIATVDLKKDECGLIQLAERLSLPLKFYDRYALNRVRKIKTPSPTVLRHIGTRSVCEAAAILAACNGELIVPKHNTQNVTVAIARRAEFGIHRNIADGKENVR